MGHHGPIILISKLLTINLLVIVLWIVLLPYSRDNYSWDELKQRPLPDGVDPSRLEKYLSDDDFVAHLGLNREEFMAAPRWKQLEIRKEKGLFLKKKKKKKKKKS